jgi:hypothetical protein
MKEYITGFNKWSKIFENESTDDINQKIEDLRNLVNLGMIDKHVLTSFLRKRGANTIIEQVPEIQTIVNSPEYAELQSHGLSLVSSRTQLLNGSIIFAYPGYTPTNQFAIGIFPGPKLVRRLTPKGIELGVWRRHIGSMDVQIKKFPAVQDDQFYRVAMRWILDHIDFEETNQRTGTPYFPVKNRTRKGYFGRD